MPNHNINHESEVRWGARAAVWRTSEPLAGDGLRVLFAPARHLFMGGKPAFAARLHVLDEPREHGHARAMPSDMRMHGEQEQAAFVPRAVEFSGEDLFDR